MKEIYDLPPVFYVRGKLQPEDQRSVAVVGTRRPTAYGREAAYRLTSDLARSGIVIVSGLAREIDAVAHRAALFPEDDTESQVLSCVTFDPVHIDEVMREAGLPISTVTGAMEVREIRGLVRHVGGMNYIRLRESVAEYQAV